MVTHPERVTGLLGTWATVQTGPIR